MRYPHTMLLQVLMNDDEFWAQWPEVLSISDQAAILRKGEATIWRWLANGEIPAYHVAGAWIVYREVLRQRLTDPDKPLAVPENFLATFPPMLTVAELSEILGKTKPTVWKWLANERLPGVGSLFGRNWVIPKTDVVKLLEHTSNQTSRATEIPSQR